jgi:hypothetical protein
MAKLAAFQCSWTNFASTIDVNLRWIEMASTPTSMGGFYSGFVDGLDPSTRKSDIWRKKTEIPIFAPSELYQPDRKAATGSGQRESHDRFDGCFGGKYCRVLQARPIRRSVTTTAIDGSLTVFIVA